VSVAATAGSRTQVAQAVFAALATTTSAVINLDALGLGTSGGSAALRLAGLATAATRDAEASQGTATLMVAGSGGGDSSVKGWEIPLIVLGALATLALLLTVAYFCLSRRQARGARSRGTVAKHVGMERPGRSVAIDVTAPGDRGDSTGYASSPAASSDGTGYVSTAAGSNGSYDSSSGGSGSYGSSSYDSSSYDSSS
jgi:hypothetical protein